MVETVAAALMDAREARDAGADLVELRVDAFFHGSGGAGGDDVGAEIDSIVKMVSQCALPCIVTCRPVLEGGQYEGPDDARIALYERLGTAGGPGESPPRYIDVELDTYVRSANIKQKVNLAVDHPDQLRAVSTSLILSNHDFHTRPADLIRRIGAMAQEPAASVVKIAFRARSLRDNLELLDILAENSTGKPTIALAMGPFGLMSRVLAPKFGAFLTFASLRRDSATAPGQPVMNELVGTYRFRSIGEQTKVYGVIGWPVEHSISPLVHNAGFEAVGHDGVFLPLPTAPEWESFKANVLSMLDHVHLDWAGAAVTVPHKEHLVRLAREQREGGDERWHLDRLSDVCGAANTIVIHRDARGQADRIEVINTDGPAAAGALREALGTPLKGLTIAILGAGGTARALSAALLDEGAKVVIINRTRDKAEKLASDLHTALKGVDIRAAELTDLAALAPAAVFNCTTVGMASGDAPGQSPLNDADLRNLPASCVVCDSVYRPLRTPLLVMASASGRRTLDGTSFFVAQASEQFALWTGRNAPRSLFSTIVRETLEAGSSPSASDGR